MLTRRKDIGQLVRNMALVKDFTRSSTRDIVWKIVAIEDIAVVVLVDRTFGQNRKNELDRDQEAEDPSMKLLLVERDYKLEAPTLAWRYSQVST